MALLRKSILETLIVTETKTAPKVAGSFLTPVDELGVGSSGLAELSQAQPSRTQGFGLTLRSSTVEKGWVATRARFRGSNGAILVAGDVVSVRFAIVGPLPSRQVLQRGTIPVRSAFGAIRLEGWDADTKGYNFYHLYNGAAFERGGTEYLIEYEIVDRLLRRSALVHEVYVHGTVLRTPTRF